jgi:fatty acid synthase subunit alpha
MILGVGCDILDFKRIRPLEGCWNDPFFARAFTERERQDCLASESPLKAFSARFSMKEAVFKALRMNPDKAAFRSIEYTVDELGRPSVRLTDAMDAQARSHGPYQLQVSVSYEESSVLTFAILETADD